MSRQQTAQVEQTINPETGTSVAELLEALRHPNAKIRQRAARALGTVADGDSAPVKARLLTALHDENPDVRRAAVAALDKLDESTAVSTTTQSGGVDVRGEMVSVGGDMVGRDKIVVLEATADPAIRASSAYYTGVRLIEQDHWYEGLLLLEQSLAIRRELDDLIARADTIYQIARTHHLIGNFDNARTRYRDALRLYERTGNERGIAACRAGLGRLMMQIGFIAEAISNLKSARQIYRKLSDRQEIVKVEEVLQLARHMKERQLA